jgi:hypothetical protein
MGKRAPCVAQPLARVERVLEGWNSRPERRMMRSHGIACLEGDPTVRNAWVSPSRCSAQVVANIGPEPNMFPSWTCCASGVCPYAIQLRIVQGHVMGVVGT